MKYHLSSENSGGEMKSLSSRPESEVVAVLRVGNGRGRQSMGYFKQNQSLS